MFLVFIKSHLCNFYEFVKIKDRDVYNVVSMITIAQAPLSYEIFKKQNYLTDEPSNKYLHLTYIYTTLTQQTWLTQNLLLHINITSKN